MRSMRVAEVWRYPVKSMGGERLDAATVDERGLHADRLWAVRDVELGVVTTARRWPDLLLCSARFAHEPGADAGPGRPVPVVVTFPDGAEHGSDDPEVDRKLSELIGKPAELVPLPARDDRRGYRGILANQADIRRQFDVADDEPLPDFSMFPLRKLAELARYATPVGAFHDAYAVHVLTTASLEAMREQAPDADFDVRRFRPTLLVDAGDERGLIEFGWCGGTLHAGTVEITPEIPTIRCSMPTRRQPDMPADPDVMRTVKANADRCLGVYGDVRRPGRVAVGDEVRFAAPAAATPIGSAATKVRDGLRRGVLRASNAAMPRGR